MVRWRLRISLVPGWACGCGIGCDAGLVSHHRATRATRSRLRAQIYRTAALSDRRSNVGVREIVTFEQQRFTCELCERIGKAIAEIELGGMAAAHRPSQDGPRRKSKHSRGGPFSISHSVRRMRDEIQPAFREFEICGIDTEEGEPKSRSTFTLRN